MSGDTARGIGRNLQDVAEMNRQGTLIPAIMEGATQLLGTEQEKKLFRDMKKMEKMERSAPNEGLFELFKF